MGYELFLCQRIYTVDASPIKLNEPQGLITFARNAPFERLSAHTRLRQKRQYNKVI